MTPTTTNNYTHERTEAAVGASLAEKYLRPRIMEVSVPDGSTAEVLIVPRGFEVKSAKGLLDEYRTEPDRRRGTAELNNLASFINHVNRFKDEGSALFATKDPAELLAVLDYHPQGKPADARPRFGSHRSSYKFPFSSEWQAWEAINKEVMSQQQFAEFIEDHIFDVVSPEKIGNLAQEFVDAAQVTLATPSRLLELSRGLTIREGSTLKNVQNLQSGEANMVFVTAHTDEAGAPLSIPSAFLIAIPVFENGDTYQLPVRLRYRVANGSVRWFFELYGNDRIFDNAFQEACDQAEEATELPLFMGTPE